MRPVSAVKISSYEFSRLLRFTSKVSSGVLGFALTTSLLQAQQTSGSAHSSQTTVQQSVDVLTTVEPFPFEEGDRSVETLETRGSEEPELLFNDVEGYLQQDPSVDLQVRGGGGIQEDLAIRGTTFEQTLVLLNGLRINDPESGHLNLDIPVPLEAISRIDVLHGSGSTFYGSDAIGGAVNLITSQPPLAGPRYGLALKSGYGNYGSSEEHLLATLRTQPFSEQLSAARDASDGFMPDRGYHANTVASETWLNLRPGTTDLLFAASDRPYGANLFYGPYDSWERTKGWLASIQQQLGANTAGSFGYRRHTDLFVLLLDHPEVYRNNHIDTSYEGALRRADTFHRDTTLSYGLEADGDSILSSNLGHHARNQGAGYANLSLNSLGRFSLSAGAREELFSGGGSVFSPSVAAAYALSGSVRLRASAGHGFRLPTYTDLYYSDPSTVGNAALKPESSWSYDAGLDWNSGGRYTLTTTAFRLQQQDSIDYSKYSLTAPWRANNIPNLNSTGAEAQLRVRLTQNQQLRLGYTAVQAGSPPAGLLSKYAYNYAAQNAKIAWTAQVAHQVAVYTQLAVLQRTQQTAYPVWDVSLARNSGTLRPYVRMMNITNTGYEDIPGVPLQGRTVVGGAEVRWASGAWR